MPPQLLIRSWILYLICTFFLPLAAQIGPGQFFLKNRLVSAVETNRDEEQLNNWLDAGYRYNNWRAGLRLEYHEPRNASVYNDKITQRYLEFKWNWLRMKAGNFYEQLGRGLVFHAFEIQNQTIDRTDVNVAIDRNIDGFNVKMAFDKFEATALWGKPLQMLSSRRGDPLGGGEVKFRPLDQLMIGGTALRYQTENFQGNPFSVDLASAQAGLILGDFDLFTELAFKQSENTAAEADGKAIYSSLNYSGAWIGLSAEFKRYEDFGTIFNNLPALVKTHSFVLLNRHTHTLIPQDETGYQLEAVISPTLTTFITLHASGAADLDYSANRRFNEYFIESRTEWSEKFISRALIDYSRDLVVGDLDRWTIATEFDYILSPANSILIDGQFQRINNELSKKFSNLLGLIAYSRAPWLTISAQLEHTTDPFSPQKNWFAGILNLKAGEHHDFILTGGSRPAGLVCSGGVCFQVPEFEGVELRWTVRY